MIIFRSGTNTGPLDICIDMLWFHFICLLLYWRIVSSLHFFRARVTCAYSCLLSLLGCESDRVCRIFMGCICIIEGLVRAICTIIADESQFVAICCRFVFKS